MSDKTSLEPTTKIRNTSVSALENEHHGRRSYWRSILIVMTVTSGMLVNTANTTSISISLATISRDLDLEVSQLQWVVSGYSLSSGCLLLVLGRLADLYGQKKMFLAGSLWLTAFTLGCAFANNVITLSVLRGFQGIGAAATIPASIGILAHSFPPSPARSLAFATFGAGAPIGAVFGSALGGLLTEYTDKTWRSPFYLQTGLTFLCLLGGLISFDPDLPSKETDRRVDFIGAFLVTVGLVLVIFALGQGENAPNRWATPYIISLLIVGVLFLILFVFWQQHLEKIHEHVSSTDATSIFAPPPLLKISIWSRAHGRLAATMLIAFFTWCSFLAWMYWMQLYYQTYRHLTAIQTVIRVLPMFVSGLFCNFFVGIMAARIPFIYLMVTGALCTSIACLLFAVIKPDVTYWAFGFPAATISVVGADFVFAAGTLYVAKVVLPHEQSLAGGLFQTMTQLGTSVGTTVSTVVFNRVSQQHPGEDLLKSYKAAQWTCFAFGCLAVALAAMSFSGVGVVGDGGQKSDSKKSTSESTLPTGEKIIKETSV